MNVPLRRATSVCPHDCPSSCSLEVELLPGNRLGRVHGHKRQSYTDGVICEKVARYAERLHHADRLMTPMQRVGAKGDGEFRPISWEAALDAVAEAFLKAEREHGSQSVWPYYYAGTMGLVMRDGINRLTHVKGYSGLYDTFCVALAWPGYIAGTGALRGADPREMAKSDCVVIWGTNPVHTQVNVMTHALRARKERGAKIVVVDIYETATMKQADLGVIVKPGTDGALAVAVMHILFRDGFANWDYLEKYTDDPRGLAAHLSGRPPEWASAITGVPVADIEALARLIGENRRSFFRIGYGFSRQRNGSANVHAVTCIPAVTGAWELEGGGAFHSNSGMYKLNKTLIEGLGAKKAHVRELDQAHIGPVLLGEAEALAGGPPVMAMLVQSTNPASVAPDQEKVKRGLARDDLFLCVHEQFMTETARFADIVLPATMFLEHDDIYQGGGHQHLMFGPKLMEPPGQCRSNHDVICALAARLGAEHAGFAMSPREIIDWTLAHSRRPPLAEWEADGFLDVQVPFREAHFLDGFAHPDGKFRFRPDWAKAGRRVGLPAIGPHWEMPELPDHWDVIENADAAHPFRLATSPARGFLNSTFTETPGSRKRENRPSVMAHPDDLARLGIADGTLVELGNARGTVRLHAKASHAVKPGILIAESIWPNSAHEGGRGINTLTAATRPAPAGGAAYHDIKVWMRAATEA